MSTDSGKSNTLPKLRTFAADLERVRGKKDPTDPKKEDTKVASQKGPDITVVEKTTTPKENPKPVTKKPKKRRPVPHIPEAKPVAKPASESKNIPPFHQIDKRKRALSSIDTSDIEEKQKDIKPSVLESVAKDGLDITEEDEGVGTVVSDVKRKRFRFFPELFSSIRESLIEIGEYLTGANKRKYSVSSTNRRKGVIQTATSTSGRFATSDHSQVISRLRKSKQAAKKTIPETEEEPTTEDTDAVTALPIDDGIETDPSHLLEPPEPEVSAKKPEPKPRAVAVPTTEVDEKRNIKNVTLDRPKRAPSLHATVPDLTPVVPSEPPVQRARVAEPTSAPVAPEPAPTPQTSGAFNTQIAAEEQYPEPEPLPEDNAYEAAAPTNKLTETNLLAVGSVASMLLLVGSFLLFQGLIQNFIATTVSTEPVSYEPFITTIETRTTAIPELTVPAILAELPADSEESIAVIPVRTTETKATHVRASELLPLLQTNVDSSFANALNGFAFGSSAQTPFIVLQVIDSNTVRGGMLSWEPTMAADLASVFGSYEPATTTVARGQLSPFSDEVIGAMDVRVLEGNSGTHITYGMLPNQLLLITTDTAAFNRIAEALSSDS